MVFLKLQILSHLYGTRDPTGGAEGCSGFIFRVLRVGEYKLENPREMCTSYKITSLIFFFTDIIFRLTYLQLLFALP